MFKILTSWSIFDALHPVEAPPLNIQLQLIKGQFESLKIDITSRLETLLSKTSKATQVLNPASVTVYDEILSETSTLFNTDLALLTQ